jgi:hypothetical protein
MAINGAMPNQAKKQRKKASHAQWKARIGGVENVSSRMRAAFPWDNIGGISGYDKARCQGPPPRLQLLRGESKQLMCLGQSAARFFGNPKLTGEIRRARSSGMLRCRATMA